MNRPATALLLALAGCTGLAAAPSGSAGTLPYSQRRTSRRNAA